MAGEPVIGRHVLQTGQLPQPIGFVFTAGVARCAAEVGMLEAMLDAGVAPDVVVGSSFGAFNAAAVATQLDGCVDRLKEFWAGLAADKSWASRFRGVVRTLTSKQSRSSGGLLGEHAARLLGDARLDAAGIVGCCVATDVVTGLACEIDSGSAADAAMAAAAVPVLLPPVVRGEQVLVDGGVVAAVPVAQAQARGARSVVVFDVGASARTVEAVEGMRWYEIGALAYAHVIRGQAGSALSQVGRDIPVVVVSTGSGDPLDFTATAQLIDDGFAVAQERIARLPRIVRQPGLYGIPMGMEHDDRLSRLARS